MICNRDPAKPGRDSVVMKVMKKKVVDIKVAQGREGNVPTLSCFRPSSIECNIEGWTINYYTV